MTNFTADESGCLAADMFPKARPRERKMVEMIICTHVLNL